MSDTAPRPLWGRILDAVTSGARQAFGTVLFLLRIVVPITFGMALLGWSGVLPLLAGWLSPLMRLIGLPGEAALVFLSSLLLNLYSAIAVAGSLNLDLREATILAIMCLTAHNLLVETAVMRKTGSSGTKMVFLRVVAALFLGWIYSLALPEGLSGSVFSAALPAERPDFWGMLAAWALSAGRLSLKIALLVLGVMILQRLLEEFQVMDFLSRILAPLMKLFGLPEGASFLWIVINLVGYAYGAGIVVEQISQGRMKPQEGDLFNHHAGICHSLLEDSALYLAIGIPLFWVTVPRLAMALVVVWAERLRRHYFRRSFRAGTAA
jgi:hypothetical protein